MTAPEPALFGSGEPVPEALARVYERGHVKRNPATGEVAIRTIFDDTVGELAHMAWLAASVGNGPRHYPTSAVDTWDDLYIPPLVVPSPQETS